MSPDCPRRARVFGARKIGKRSHFLLDPRLVSSLLVTFVRLQDPENYLKMKPDQPSQTKQSTADFLVRIHSEEEGKSLTLS